MTLDTIYRDVNSKLSVYHEYEEKFYSLDTIKAINDAIAIVRTEATTNRLGEQIATTQVVTSLTSSTNHPYLVEGTLTLPIINSVDPMTAILQADYWITATPLAEGSISATAGDKRNIGKDLYQCVESHTGVATYDKTFVGRVLRYFSANNGARYHIGDVILSGGSYWEITEAFTNNETQTIEEGARFTKVYWVHIGLAFGPTSIYTFERISQMKLLSDDECTGTRGVAVKKDKVYCSPNTPKLTITYVPEWVFEDDLDAELDLPTEWLPDIKTRAVEMLTQRLRLTQPSP
jgi:hypothetical protein